MGFGRRLVLLAVLALAVLGFAAAPASAVITNIIPFNGAGDPALDDPIFDDGEVWAYYTSPTGGVICIERLTANPEGCGGSSAGSTTPVLPFSSGLAPIAQGNLGAGTYVLVGSENEDSPAEIVSEPFYVKKCETSCTFVSPNKVSDFKLASNALLSTVKDMCGKVAALDMLWRTRNVARMTDLIVGSVGSGPVGLGFSIAIGTELAKETYQVVKGDESVLPGQLSTVADGVCKVADKIDKLKNSTLASVVGNLSTDPPDPSGLVSKPVFTDFDSILGLKSLGFDAARDRFDATTAYGTSALHDYERFQGAEQIASIPGEHRQLRQLGDDLLGYAQSLRANARFLHATAARMRAEIPDAADRGVTQDQLDQTNAVRDRVEASGFTAQELSELASIGVTGSFVDALRFDQTINDPSDATPGALDTDLDTAADQMIALADASEEWAHRSTTAAARDAAPLVPDFAADQYVSTDLLRLTLTDTTDLNGDPATIDWDFGDGSTASGHAVVHSFAARGSYSVTETVTTDYDTQSITKQVFAGPAPQPPTASFTTTPSTGEVPLDVSFDASASTTDPAATIVDYKWDYGDGSGPEVTQTPAAAHQYIVAGTFTAKLTVSDSNGLTATTTRTVHTTFPETAPVAEDDSVAIQGLGTVDVLLNDHDDNADLLTVHDFTQPEHGSVACVASGVCTFTPAAGYAGPDSFTYVARDSTGRDSNSATVSVTITPPLDPSVLTAAPDEIVARSGHTVTAHPLSNDRGAGALAISGSDQPHHGSVSCDADSCDYTPEAGFTGSDGFAYHAVDAASHTGDGEVHVRVLAAGAAYGVAVGGSPASTVAGGQASWSVAASGLSDSLPPVLGAEPGSGQTLVPGSVTAAKGWTPNGTTATAGSAALLGDSTRSALVEPLATVSQGTGGDSHVPILVGGRVYGVYHYDSPTKVTCIDRETNAVCPGYPVPVNAGADELPGPGVVVGTKIWMHLQSLSSGVQYTPITALCFDTATAEQCGFLILDRIRGQVQPRVAAPVRANGKLWFAAQTGKLYCVDPATSVTCGTISTGLGASDPDQHLDVIARDSRVYVALQKGHVTCVDVGTGSTCAGWTLPRSLTNAGWDLIRMHDASGSVVGVCVAGDGQLDCWRDTSPGTAQHHDGFLDLDGIWDYPQEAETATRTFVGAYPTAGLGCWDWVTMARCVGGDYDVDGWVHKDGSNTALPTAYAAVYDGSCVIGLGDPGLVFAVDPKGFAPCGGVGRDETVDLRDQRCDNTVGAATWDTLALVDAEDGELGAVRVTVRDAATGTVLATKNLAAGALDLSGIDAHAHPALTYTVAVVKLPGKNAWADHVPPRVELRWHADPATLCFKTATAAHCDAPFAPVGVGATLGAATATASVATSRPSTCVDPTPTPTAKPVVTPTPAPPPVVNPLLACSDRPVVLEDVYIAAGKVHLVGVAAKKYAGQKVSLVFVSTKKVVATATVGPDGRYAATAPLPPAKLRKSSATRYLAKVADQSSLKLKLARRMLVTSVTAAGGKVTIKGTISGPYAKAAKDRLITLERIIACKTEATVKVFAPAKPGAFSITVPAPTGERAAVYRLSTKVLNKANAKKPVTTFTLPRAVDFG